jgi:hypothetical protein
MMQFPKDVELNELGVPKEVFFVHGGEVIRCEFVRRVPGSFGGRTICQYEGPDENYHLLWLSFQEVNPPIFLRKKDAEDYVIISLVV